MNEKHREVRVWLEKVFAGAPIPQYEISQRPLDLLYNLMQKNTSRDTDIQLLVDDLKQKAEEYNLEAVRIARVLQNMGLSTGNLSQSGLVSLRTLASIALLLDIRDASDTSYLLGMSDMSQSLMQLSEARRDEQRLSAQLLGKTKLALQKSNSLKRALAALKEQEQHQGPELQKKAKQAGFLQNKAKEYKTQIERLQTQLSASGIEPSTYHETLVKKSKELDNLKGRLHPLKAKLDSYNKLPPNISLAKVKIEEAKREVALLEAELSRNIDLMHM